MYLHNVLFSACVLMAAAGAAANVSLPEILPLIPKCALKCLISDVPIAALTDIKLLCANTTLQLSLSSCIQGTCNYTEQITIGGLNGKVCDGFPEESRSMLVGAFGMVLGPLALIAVALRFYSRITIAKQLGADDWLILAAAAVVATLSILDIQNCLGNGFGRHLWNIDPSRTTELLKIFYACEILYLLVMTLIKASILVFYLRIFQSSWFWAADIVVLIGTVAAGVATCLAAVFQCTPISGVWTLPAPTTCVNVNLLAFTSGAITIFFDIIVLILPIPELIRLRMSMRKKFTILIMFSLGSLACITSIIRLKYLISFAKSKDASFDNSPAVIWTLLEISVSMICSCLPAIRGLLSKIFPAFFELTVPEPEKPPSFSNLKAPLAQFTRLEKRGPSYNKWAIPSGPPSPEPVELEDAAGMFGAGTKTESRRNTETKICIQPRFNQAGELTEFVPPGLEFVHPELELVRLEAEQGDRSLRQISSRSTGTSLWCLEGPRMSEDISRTLGMETDREGLVDKEAGANIDEERNDEQEEEIEEERGRKRERDVEACYPDAASVKSVLTTRTFLSSSTVRE